MWERKTDVLRNIVERTNDSRLRVCWDCGHSNVFGELTPSEWIQRLAGVTPYAHWNDNFGDRDSELPLGEGNIDWGEIVQLSSQLSEPQLVVLEVGLIDNVKRSLDFLSQNGLLMAG
jgi:sugar phosphate isomerase/epimerase